MTDKGNGDGRVTFSRRVEEWSVESSLSRRRDFELRTPRFNGDRKKEEKEDNIVISKNDIIVLRTIFIQYDSFSSQH